MSAKQGGVDILTLPPQGSQEDSPVRHRRDPSQKARHKPSNRVAVVSSGRSMCSRIHILDH